MKDEIEVKWCLSLEERCPGRDGCVLEVEVMTAEELLQRYAAGERDFIGVDLSGVDLSEANLGGVDFSSGIDLSEANLSNVKLIGTDLTMAILCRANLKGAKIFKSPPSRDGVYKSNRSAPNQERQSGCG